MLNVESTVCDVARCNSCTDDPMVRTLSLLSGLLESMGYVASAIATVLWAAVHAPITAAICYAEEQTIWCDV